MKRDPIVIWLVAFFPRESEGAERWQYGWPSGAPTLKRGGENSPAPRTGAGDEPVSVAG